MSVVVVGFRAAAGFVGFYGWQRLVVGDRMAGRRDTVWCGLRVMCGIDANGGGLVQAGEKILVSLNIASLNTGCTASAPVDGCGHEDRQVGGYAKPAGSMAAKPAVWFVISMGGARYERLVILAHSAAIAALPDLPVGRVYALRDGAGFGRCGRRRGQQSADGAV